MTGIVSTTTRFSVAAFDALMVTLFAAPAAAAALSQMAHGAWGSVESGLDKVAQAFNLPTRR